MACGPREAAAAHAWPGSDSTGSPAPSRGRGRPRQAGPSCRWAAGEEAEAGWAGKEEGKRAGVRFPGPREEKEKEKRDWAGLKMS